MLRKEKAYVWVTHEVSKREELVIRLWFLLGQLGKLIFLFDHIYSIIFIQHFTFKTPERLEMSSGQ